MEKTSKTIVFFGSGPVAKASLASLVENFDVEAVVTKPVTANEMSGTAPKSNLYKVTNADELTKLIRTNPFKSEIGVIVDFGIIVQQPVIDYFPLGIVNSHFSLLPEWRGADPITFAILSGQKKSGVSLMLIVEKLDEGKLLAQSTLEIAPDATTPTLTKDFIELSNAMIKEILPLYMQGEVVPYDQRGDIKPTYSRKLTKQDGILDWNKTALELEREIRAYIEWPKSRMTLSGKDVIITKAHAAPGTTPDSKPGDITVVPEAKTFAIATTDGSLWIDRLKPADKKEMDVSAFLAGYGYLLKNV